MKKYSFILSFILFGCYLIWPHFTKAKINVVGSEVDKNTFHHLVNETRDINTFFNDFIWKSIETDDNPIAVYLGQNIKGVVLYQCLLGSGIVLDLADLEKLPEGGWDGDIFYVAGPAPQWAFTRHEALAEALDMAWRTASGILYSLSVRIVYEDLLTVRNAFNRGKGYGGILPFEKDIFKEGNRYTVAILKDYVNKKDEWWTLSNQGKLLEIRYFE